MKHNSGSRHVVLVSTVVILFVVVGSRLHQLYAVAEYVDGIVAIANDEVITIYDVASITAEAEKKLIASYSPEERANKETENKIHDEIRKIREKAANDLIDEKVIYAEFLERGYQIPKEMVEKRIDSMVASQAGGDWQQFEEMLKSTSTTLAEFRERMERRLAVELLLNQVIDRKLAVISPEQIEIYYNQNRASFAKESRIKLQLIQLPGSMKSSRVSDAVNEVMQSLKRGADFKDLARGYSKDRSSKEGGELGWSNQNHVRAEFLNAFKKLQKGAVSEPFELLDNTYILRIADINSGTFIPLKEASERIRRMIYDKEKTDRYKTYIKKLRDQTYIKLYY